MTVARLVHFLAWLLVQYFAGTVALRLGAADDSRVIVDQLAALIQYFMLSNDHLAFLIQAALHLDGLWLLLQILLGNPLIEEL